jgi:hypothetical protein
LATKRSSSEEDKLLSTACYVNLSDISKANFGLNDQILQFEFDLTFSGKQMVYSRLVSSRAYCPGISEFFSLEGELLSNKKSLERQIHEITNIPVEALQRNPSSQFTVKERMSWAAKRRTKRKKTRHTVYSAFPTSACRSSMARARTRRSFGSERRSTSLH